MDYLVQVANSSGPSSTPHNLSINQERRKNPTIRQIPTIINLEDVDSVMASCTTPAPREFNALRCDHIPQLKQYISYPFHVLISPSRHSIRPFYKYRNEVFKTLNQQQKLVASLLMHYTLYVLLSQSNIKKDVDTVNEYRGVPGNPLSTLPIVPNDIDTPSLQRAIDGFSDRAQLFMLRSIAVALNNINDTYCKSHLTIDLTHPDKLDKQHTVKLSETLMTVRSAYTSSTSPVSSATPLRDLIPQQPIDSPSSHGQSALLSLTNSLTTVTSECQLDYEKQFCVSMIYTLRQYIYGNNYVIVHDKALQGIRSLYPADNSFNTIHIIGDDTIAQLINAIVRHINVLEEAIMFLKHSAQS
jgi:hypothetical protein